MGRDRAGGGKQKEMSHGHVAPHDRTPKCELLMLSCYAAGSVHVGPCPLGYCSLQGAPPNGLRVQSLPIGAASPKGTIPEHQEALVL